MIKKKSTLGIGLKSSGFVIIAAGGMYGAVTKDFRIGGIIFALGALFVAVGEFF